MRFRLTSGEMSKSHFIMHMPGIILFLVLVTAVSACVPESCYQETVSTVKAGFFETGSGLQLKADSVTLTGEGAVASPPYLNAKNLQSIKFELDPSSTGCVWYLKINGVTDTLTFLYQSFPHLISKECGYSIYHTIGTIEFTGNIIDTVIIRNPSISVLNEENIRIFF